MASSGPPKVDINLPAQTARVEGKNILITGGASGLGLAMFREFARHGYVSAWGHPPISLLPG
jgi:FlaA1/EpsC-like NDP-sugar epimerase